MEIIDFVRIKDNVLPYAVLGKFLDFLNLCEFVEAKTIGENNDNNIPSVKTHRNAEIFPFTNDNNSLSNVHWHNLLASYFMQIYKEYNSFYEHVDVQQIIDISALRYRQGCFYKVHTDHHSAIPRTLSLIFLLNNDYEGGNLVFHDPTDNKKTYPIEVRPNRTITWLSNSLFPHEVKEVTKGTRYSVVSWAL